MYKDERQETFDIVYARSTTPDGRVLWHARSFGTDGTLVSVLLEMVLHCDENGSWRTVEHVFVNYLCDRHLDMEYGTIGVCDPEDNLSEGREADAVVHVLDYKVRTMDMPVRTNFVDSVEVDSQLSGVTIRVNFPHRAPVEFSCHIGENDESEEFEERLVVTAGAGLLQWDDGNGETGPRLREAFPREHVEFYCDAETGLILDGQFCYDQDTTHWNSCFEPFSPPTRGHYVEDGPNGGWIPDES